MPCPTGPPAGGRVPGSTWAAKADAPPCPQAGYPVRILRSNKGRFLMANLVIQLHGDVAHDPCALCGRHTVSGERPQLVLADTLDVVCRDCGRKHDPSLASLLDLA